MAKELPAMPCNHCEEDATHATYEMIVTYMAPLWSDGETPEYDKGRVIGDAEPSNGDIIYLCDEHAKQE